PRVSLIHPPRNRQQPRPRRLLRLAPQRRQRLPRRLDLLLPVRAPLNLRVRAAVQLDHADVSVLSRRRKILCSNERRRFGCSGRRSTLVNRCISNNGPNRLHPSAIIPFRNSYVSIPSAIIRSLLGGTP